MRFLKMFVITTLLLSLTPFLAFGIPDPYPDEPDYYMYIYSVTWEYDQNCNIIAVCKAKGWLDHAYASSGSSECYAQIGIEVYQNGQQKKSNCKTNYGTVSAYINDTVSVNCSGLSTDGLTAIGYVKLWGCFEGENEGGHWSDSFDPPRIEEEQDYYSPPIPKPTKPTVKIANAGQYNRAPILSWTASKSCDPNPVTYHLYRDTYIASGDWTEIWSGTSTTYTDNDVLMQPQSQADDKFYYKVEAQNSGGLSGFSNIVSTWGDWRD
jgi:hypothetical protein